MGDNNQRTPLICASRLGDVEIVRVLLDAGACADTVDNVGWTALNQAIEQFRESDGEECYTEIINLLKQANAEK